MTRETLIAVVTEIDAVLKKYDMSLEAEGGNGPVQLFEGYETFDPEVEVYGWEGHLSDLREVDEEAEKAERAARFKRDEDPEEEARIAELLKKGIR